jgi:hypothetical protein
MGDVAVTIYHSLRLSAFGCAETGLKKVGRPEDVADFYRML